MKRIVIVGATSGIAVQCARLWAKATIELALVGRDQLKLDQIAQDLMVRSPKSKILTKTADFEDKQEIETLVSELSEKPVDIVLIAHGTLPDQKQCQKDLLLCQRTLEINGVSPALFAEAFSKAMEKFNWGTLAIIGSVAGDRGRKSNYVYGAAKGLIERYAQGLQHRFANTKVNVVLIKPGPTDTPMTALMKSRGLQLASPQVVARDIVNGIDKGSRLIYTPKKWGLIMMAVKLIPSVIFNKTNL